MSMNREQELQHRNDELLIKLAAAKQENEQLRVQIVMKFTEERVPQFSQGFESHELLEIVTAEDCKFYVERIEHLQAEIKRLERIERLFSQGYTERNIQP